MSTTTNIQGTYSPGKCDYNGTGRKINRVKIEWELSDGTFTAHGAILNGSGTDWLSGGQNLDTIAELFPHDRIVQRIFKVWRDWHLNTMHAGSPAQEALLKHAGIKGYEAACAYLESVGLLIDPTPDLVLGSTDGYRYGSAWLTRELPAAIVAEINSWVPMREVQP